MEEVGEKVERMLKEEVSRGKTTGGLKEETTIKGLTQKLLWMPTAHVERVAAPFDKKDMASLFEGRTRKSEDSS
jgi:hypothetical protein